jgi:hypothetical protein
MGRISNFVLQVLLLAAAMAAASAAQSSGGGVGATQEQQQPRRPPGLFARQEQLGAGIPLHPQQTRKTLAPRPPSTRAAGKAAAAAPAASGGKVLLAPIVAKPPGAGADANAGNASLNAEAEIRKTLLEDYDKLTFPWAEYGAANVSLNVVFHRVLDVNLYAGGCTAGGGDESSSRLVSGDCSCGSVLKPTCCAPICQALWTFRSGCAWTGPTLG